MDFDGTADAYPTDGVGGSGTGSLTTASHLAGTSECVVDGVLLTTVGVTDRVLTLKDAAGSTLLAITVDVSATPSGSTIDFGPNGININSANGFTMQSANSDLSGTIFYRIIRKTPA